MKLIFHGILFFSFFTSFAILNIQSIDWGLQMSWFLSLIFIIIFPVYLLSKKHLKFTFNKNIKYVSIYFSVVIFCTLLSWILQKSNVIKLENENLLFYRALSHTIYLIFCFIVFVLSSLFIQNVKNQKNLLKWFIAFPFFIITLWGIYQWITTFDIVPYLEIFNNNISTGFTYLRFKDAHRASSIFPEPSEYAYYLAFIMPFIWYQYKNKSIFFSSANHLFVGVIYILSILLCRSLSLFLVLPILILFVGNDYIKMSISKITVFTVGIICIICVLIYVERERFFDFVTGNDSSTLIRLKAFNEGINLFISSPFLGCGFGAIRGLDLLSFLFATTGIIGTITFFVIMKKLKPANHVNALFLKGLYCMITVTLISNPIIDQIFFWIILALVSNPIHISNDRSHSNIVQS
jgi:hypothetical protein